MEILCFFLSFVAKTFFDQFLTNGDNNPDIKISDHKNIKIEMKRWETSMHSIGTIYFFLFFLFA